MKNLFLTAGLLYSNLFWSQFTINIEAPLQFSEQKVLLYTLNGSKDYIATQAHKKNGKWILKMPEYYKGILKAYFPESNQSINFISENKDVFIKFDILDNKIQGINFLDEANKKWNETLLLKRKKEEILPLLSQIKTFYNDQSNFDLALENEILLLDKTLINTEENSFLKYYLDHLSYTQNSNNSLTYNDYKQVIINSGEMLESSSLMRPILINFLKTLSRENLQKEIDNLLDELNLETHRGQTILAEFLSIFEAYGLNNEKEKYYQKATALTCSINKNLETSIKAIKNTSIGANFEDYTFSNLAKNTQKKKLSEIKSDKKLILFWSSTCPHCLSELPIILKHYSTLKQQGIEVIALSLDTDKNSYHEKTTALPWIQDTELKGWKSSFVEKYNVNSTPTYYLLDNNLKIIDKPMNFSVFFSTINSK